MNPLTALAFAVFMGVVGFAFGSATTTRATVAETPDADPRKANDEYDPPLGSEGGYGFIRPSGETNDGFPTCDVDGCGGRAVARLVVPAIPPEEDTGLRCSTCLKFDLNQLDPES